MATITDFRNALLSPRRSFRSLSELVWSDQTILRSTLFAEAKVERAGEKWMIYMPLSALSLRRVERFLPLKRHLLSHRVPQLLILRSEMLYDDALRGELSSDILLEPLPEGRSFADAVAAINSFQEAKALLSAIDELQQNLRLADISHNNVREENLLLSDDGALHLIRWYYATASAGGDDEAFATLREKIAKAGSTMELNSSQAEYVAEPLLSGHLTLRPMREGLAAVEDESGWGFVDSENRYIIPAIYEWVNDFREGRSEVQTAEGMGLIDREGRYIIEPRYQIVEYDSVSGRSAVKNDRGWSIFDYSGVQLCDFGDEDAERECEAMF